MVCWSWWRPSFWPDVMTRDLHVHPLYTHVAHWTVESRELPLPLISFWCAASPLAMSVWVLLHLCACNTGIFRRFQQGSAIQAEGP